MAPATEVLGTSPSARDASRCTTTAGSTVCRHVGLSRSDYNALEALDEHGSLTPGELAPRLTLTSGSVTALVDRLERLGWASRDRHPEDRRKVITAHPESLGDRPRRAQPLPRSRRRHNPSTRQERPRHRRRVPHTSHRQHRPRATPGKRARSAVVSPVTTRRGSKSARRRAGPRRENRRDCVEHAEPVRRCGLNSTALPAATARSPSPTTSLSRRTTPNPVGSVVYRSIAGGLRGPDDRSRRRRTPHNCSPVRRVADTDRDRSVGAGVHLRSGDLPDRAGASVRSRSVMKWEAASISWSAVLARSRAVAMSPASGRMRASASRVKTATGPSSLSLALSRTETRRSSAPGSRSAAHRSQQAFAERGLFPPPPERCHAAASSSCVRACATRPSARRTRPRWTRAARPAVHHRWLGPSR